MTNFAKLSGLASAAEAGIPLPYVCSATGQSHFGCPKNEATIDVSKLIFQNFAQTKLTFGNREVLVLGDACVSAPIDDSVMEAIKRISGRTEPLLHRYCPALRQNEGSQQATLCSLTLDNFRAIKPFLLRDGQALLSILESEVAPRHHPAVLFGISDWNVYFERRQLLRLHFLECKTQDAATECKNALLSAGLTGIEIDADRPLICFKEPFAASFHGREQIMGLHWIASRAYHAYQSYFQRKATEKETSISEQQVLSMAYDWQNDERWFLTPMKVFG